MSGGITFGNATGGGGSAPVVTGANNGTSLVGGDIQLGGNPLIASTTIDLGGFSLAIIDATTGSSFAFTPATFNIDLMVGGVTTQMLVMEPGEFILSNTEPGTGNLQELAMSSGNMIFTVDDLVAVGGSIGLNFIDPTGQGKVFAFGNQVYMLWQSGGLQQGIDMQASGMVITDQVNTKGFINGGDYSAHGAADPLWLTQNNYVQSLVKVARNAANFGIVASLADVDHYDLPLGGGDTTMRVGAWLTLLSTSTPSVIVQVSYINPNSTAVTQTFFPQGAVTSVLGVPADYAFPTFDFRAKAGTTIQVSTTVSGAGSILYDVGCTIQKLIGDGGL